MRIAPLLGSSLVATAALIVPSVALANGPPVNPALGVYVEQIPTGKGSVAAKRGSQRSKLRGSLAQKIQREGGTDAGALQDLATSAGLGAPQAGRSAAQPQVRRAGSSQQTRVAAPVAAAQGTSNGNRWQVIALVLGIVLITATMAAAQFIRSRRAGPSP
jgi:hypothetical protein